MMREVADGQVRNLPNYEEEALARIPRPRDAADPQIHALVCVCTHGCARTAPGLSSGVTCAVFRDGERLGPRTREHQKEPHSATASRPQPQPAK